jgi:anti-anti-sigma factor
MWFPDALGGTMAGNASFNVAVDDDSSTIQIAPRGELDMATVPGFEEIIQACEQEPAPTIVIDLRDVSFMDSTGLRALLRARDRSLENGHRLLVVEASDPVRKVFEITGMRSVLDGEETPVSTNEPFTRPWTLIDAPAGPGDLRAR